MASYYNYFTGEWVSSPDQIKPRSTTVGARSGGAPIYTGEFDELQDVGFQQTSAIRRNALTEEEAVRLISGAEDTSAITSGLEESAKLDAEATAAAAAADLAVKAAESATKAVPGQQLPPPPQTTFVASDGTVFVDQDSRNRYEQSLSNKEREGRSAFALLESEFNRLGLQSLIEPLRRFIKQGLSRDELLLELRKDPAYETRFSANKTRIDKGLRALSEAEYIGLEDQYQDIMRRYGLPESYYKKEELGRQPGFEQLIGFDVSPTELEERVMIAQNRVKNAPSEVLASLKEFYPDISNGEILAYTLDPKNAIENIKRKVLASEIGAGAMQAGLRTTAQRAEELGQFGVTAETARAGFSQIAGGLERGSQLASIYREQPYGQETAEQEVFGLAGAPSARKRRQRIIKSEEAAFGGQTGLTGGALSRERAGQY
jgi:hypothetical protein